MRKKNSNLIEDLSNNPTITATCFDHVIKSLTIFLLNTTTKTLPTFLNYRHIKYPQHNATMASNALAELERGSTL